MDIAQEWGNTVKENERGEEEVGEETREKNREGHWGKWYDGVGRLGSGGD